MSQTIRVELYGVARLLAGRKEIDLMLDGDATVGAALAALAATFPRLVGPIIAPDLRHLTEGNVLSLDGRAFITVPETPVRPDLPLLILPAIAGG
jgi:molybdopterin converting factor small subunit